MQSWKAPGLKVFVLRWVGLFIWILPKNILWLKFDTYRISCTLSPYLKHHIELQYNSLFDVVIFLFFCWPDVLIEPLAIVLQTDEKICKMIRSEMAHKVSPSADNLFLSISNSGSFVLYFTGAIKLWNVY